MGKRKGKKKKVKVPDGNPEKGQKIFESQCGVCHSIQSGDDSSGAAPHLNGVVGRKSASTKFKFSNAMKKSKITWNKSNLFQYLYAPGKFVPGNKMSYGGIKDKQERADLISYLEESAD